jgi:hypothetical protein
MSKEVTKQSATLYLSSLIELEQDRIDEGVRYRMFASLRCLHPEHRKDEEGSRLWRWEVPAVLTETLLRDLIDGRNREAALERVADALRTLWSIALSNGDVGGFPPAFCQVCYFERVVQLDLEAQTRLVDGITEEPIPHRASTSRGVR